MDKSKINKIVSDRDQEKIKKLKEEVKLAEQFKTDVLAVYEYVKSALRNLSDDKLQQMLEHEVEIQCKEDIPDVLQFGFKICVPLVKIDNHFGNKLKTDGEWYQAVEGKPGTSDTFVLFDYREKSVVNPVAIPTLLESVNEFELLKLFTYLSNTKLIVKEMNNIVMGFESALSVRLTEFGFNLKKWKTSTDWSIGTYIIFFNVKVDNPVEYQLHKPDWAN